MEKKGRRANGEGSLIQKPNGSWQASITVTLADGSKKVKYATSKSKREAVARINEIREQYAKRTYNKEANITVEEYIYIWLWEYKKPYISPSTLDNYITKIRSYILPAIGKKQLKSITFFEIQKMFDKAYANGVAGATLNNTKILLNNMFNTALNMEKIINRNPMKEGIVRINKIKKKNKIALNKKEEKIIIEEIIKQKKWVFLFLIMSGVRASEVAGLEWSNINFDTREVHIRQQNKRIKEWKIENNEFVYKGSKREKVELKTEKSKRTIFIPTSLIEILKDYKEEMIKEFKEKNISFNNNTLVFLNKNLESLTANRIYNNFKRLLDNIEGISKERKELITPHILRHSYASRGIEEGVDVVEMSRLLGHSKIATTVEIYTHLNKEVIKKSSDTINRGRDELIREMMA